MKKVFRYDRSNPIANYRLGFLAYKYHRHSDAVLYFKNAIDYQTYAQSQDWKMNEEQLYRAHLYLVNSYLFVASRTYEKMKDLPMPEQELTQYELSPIFDIINKNEMYLNRHAFVRYTNEGRFFCSKEECDDIFYESDAVDNILILYFSDRNYLLKFNDKSIVLTAKFAELLKDLLLNSSKDQSLTVRNVKEYFNSKSEDVSKDTYKQGIRRLRRKLEEIGTPDIIVNDPNNKELAYYFNGTVQFMVMERVEEIID
ncbi:hypothetical protein EDD72_101157 [Tepidibacillus fermentans]|uniref:Uncharacterized protein n=1 Tax=Tepidibacillus fermentans TaxID=1281767 RepID=A0A4R3KKS8_9BACI|nr:hypothetical protein EDD72_101157 [Tepidibacillus fermentans]